MTRNTFLSGQQERGQGMGASHPWPPYLHNHCSVPVILTVPGCAAQPFAAPDQPAPHLQWLALLAAGVGASG
eukprot:210390-Pelagomonas_calceolata.AAC.1